MEPYSATVLYVLKSKQNIRLLFYVSMFFIFFAMEPYIKVYNQ